MVSATPSGGWLQSSPIIPGLGFCLNSRAQMVWMTPDLPTSPAPAYHAAPSLAVSAHDPARRPMRLASRR
ncbi:gamma-glutamyltranspeptidase [Aureimonas pseudogalii]|uniref:Gamma-glutamyltranspeptidase n=1 Tax=Aureimonas pseudogalii TaxID=1744844 RepID=A0A7W6MM61_9HYPH|nr:gamma-glutamyltranspeptidase [Aureimonas pseudogalii]